MPEDGLSNGHYPEVGFEEMAVDLLEDRFWTVNHWWVDPDVRDSFGDFSKAATIVISSSLFSECVVSFQQRDTISRS
jgi:hypothetical protein